MAKRYTMECNYCEERFHEDDLQRCLVCEELYCTDCIDDDGVCLNCEED